MGSNTCSAVLLGSPPAMQGGVAGLIQEASWEALCRFQALVQTEAIAIGRSFPRLGIMPPSSASFGICVWRHLRRLCGHPYTS
eukprot:136457-Alexandrium_andersonii.AAC.1